ncbi:WecB/TagA/CpsF family glycosyltransferase [Arcicella lustrica]|uniref:WecB/TagA/CpsF family glycosyltransferase n=1 Tax=Arcicella lustrica TaxID=2984196 RepID=A0ABU5SMP7_9BACT|nr:WecB/TagA/CpsF family glycosyltransferase [Arcicella sp. DC25W]MEA5428584.1 WecB/TagA/CpsF family glycosyltransferase [Arcicella sp. DC25W]
MNRHKLLSITISLGKYHEFVSRIVSIAELRQSAYVCVSNVHMCIEAYYNPIFANIVNSADIITPDGLPLVKSLKWLYGIEQDRVSGPDLMPSLLESASIKKLNVFFYGATEEVLLDLVSFCSYRYPSLNIVGAISPPFRNLTDIEIHEHINNINNVETNILFVALGCPKQEKWMSAMKGKINAVMLGVGGAFPMLVGKEKRAPLWMQKYMLEWFYRLMQDPKRLFKRYFITNTAFIFLIVKEKILIKFR